MYCLSEHIKHIEMLSDGFFKYFGNPDAKKEGALVFAGDRDWCERALKNPCVTAIITTEDVAKSVAFEMAKGLVIAASPRDVYWEAFSDMNKKGKLGLDIDFNIGENSKIHPTALVSDKVNIGDNVKIGAYAIVHDYSYLGSDCEVHEGCIIGCEGLQLYRDINGVSRLVRHAGGVKLGNAVVMLARSMVSKAVHPQFTEIGDETSLSLMVSVGHQSVIGRNCSIAGNCLLGGSLRMGNNVIVGPSVTIKDSLSIGDNARIRMGSVVVRDVLSGQDVSGNFAMSHLKNLKHFAKKSRG